MLGCCPQFSLSKNSAEDRRKINTAPTVITTMSKVLMLHKITVANHAICTLIKSHCFPCEL